MMRQARDDPFVIAHRGASAAHPENTVAAFAAAALMGAHGVELDVRRSADGELVVHHDPRYRDGRVVAEVAAADRPPGVPTLDEAVGAAAPCWVNVEVKNLPHEPGYDPAERTAAAVAGWWAGARPEQHVLVSAFTPASLAAVRAAEPELATAVLMLHVADARACVEQASSAGHVALHPHEPEVSPELVDLAHAAGLAVNVWTVDAPPRIVELAALGVDGIVTNVPDVALAALDGSGR